MNRSSTSLLAVALLLLGATSASAYSISLTSNYPGWVPLDQGDTLTVNVFLDTDGDTSGILSMSVGIQFDDTFFAYDQSASSSETYLLYIDGKTPYLTALGACGAGSCETHVTQTNQVNLDWLTSDVGGGNPAPGGTAGNEQIARLVFTVISNDRFGGMVRTVFNPLAGNLFGVTAAGVDISGQVGLPGSPIYIFDPEPSTFLLFGTGFASLGIAGRRRGRSLCGRHHGSPAEHA